MEVPEDNSPQQSHTEPGVKISAVSEDTPSYPVTQPVGTYGGVPVFEGRQCVHSNWRPVVTTAEVYKDGDDDSYFDIGDIVGLPWPQLGGIFWADFRDNYFLCRCATCNYRITYKYEATTIKCTMCSKEYRTQKEYMLDSKHVLEHINDIPESSSW